MSLNNTCKIADYHLYYWRRSRNYYSQGTYKSHDFGGNNLRLGFNYAKTTPGGIILKHYAIGGHKGSDRDGKWIEANIVESVAILKNPPVIVHCPYKGRLTRKPNHRPQLPTRGEQINAAQAFVPRLEPGIQNSPIPIATSDTTATLSSNSNSFGTSTVIAVANTKPNNTGTDIATDLSFAVSVVPAAGKVTEGRMKTRGD